MYVTTNLGYKFHTDEVLRVGTVANIPKPVIENEVDLDEAHVRFWATMYSRALSWDNSILGPYDIGAQEDCLPDEILNLTEDKLRVFINAVYDAAGKPILHKSGTGKTDIPEMWLVSKHLGVCEGYQYLLLRLGIKSKVRKLSDRKVWSTKVTGHGSFLLLMNTLTDLTHPTLLTRINRVMEGSDCDIFGPESGVVKDRIAMVSEFAPRKNRW